MTFNWLVAFWDCKSSKSEKGSEPASTSCLVLPNCSLVELSWFSAIFTCSRLNTTSMNRLITFKVMSFRVASKVYWPDFKSDFAWPMLLVIRMPWKIGAPVFPKRLTFPILLVSNKLVTGLIDLPQRNPELAPVVKLGSLLPWLSKRLVSVISWLSSVLLRVKLFSIAIETQVTRSKGPEGISVWACACCQVKLPKRIRIKSFFMCGSCWFIDSLKVNVWDVN